MGGSHVVLELDRQVFLPVEQRHHYFQYVVRRA